MSIVIFFFQAEDGIRDDLVTGVQTCALPIYAERISGQIRVDSQHEKGDQQPRGNALAHIPGKRETENQKHGAEGIDDVVYVKSIARTLSISISRQRSVQAIAKPV